MEIIFKKYSRTWSHPQIFFKDRKHLFCAQFCHNWLQARKAGAPHQIDQRTRKADNGDGFALLRYTPIYSDPPTSSSKSAPRMPTVSHFEVQIELSLQSCVLFVEAGNCGNRGPTLATPEAALPEKNKVSHPRVFSPLNSHASVLFHFPTTW